MTEWIPCPACGTEHGPEVESCDVCGFRLSGGGPPPRKCARCGSQLGEGFEFCQVCGLRVQSRLPRPSTQSLKLVPRKSGPDGAPPMELIAEPVRPTEPAPSGPEPAASAGISAEAGSALAPVPMPAPMPAPMPVQAAPPPQEPPRDPFAPGETMRARPPEDAMEPRAPQTAQPSWSAPMARLAVESSRRSSGAAPLRIVLVQRDGSEGDSTPLRGPLKIGRRGGDLLFPNDTFLSPLHAQIEPATGGGVRLSDLGAKNGVFMRISRPEPVFPGDTFLVGHHLIRLENVPAAGREQEIDGDGVRLFGTPMQPAWGRLTLIGVGGAEAEVYCLRASQIVFGRELGDIIFPTDPFVSWQHAQLAMELRGDAMTVLLTDLRSANGTYLRVRGDVILQPGDMFRVGDQIFRVRMH